VRREGEGEDKEGALLERIGGPRSRAEIHDGVRSLIAWPPHPAFSSPCVYSLQHHCYPHRPFLTFALFLFLFSLSISFLYLSFSSRYPMASHSINQYPSSVPGTSSGATMVRFSGGSPLTDPPAGHEYTSSLPEYTLGDIPTIPVSHAQYQWQPLLPAPTSDPLADSHVSQVTGPPHIRLMYSSSMATLQDQSNPPAMAIPHMRPPSPPQNEIPSPPNKPPGRYRKRVHSCSMCEKAFDRPSTLKKVHPPSFPCSMRLTSPHSTCWSIRERNVSFR
jgi:hypothetical protein